MAEEDLISVIQAAERLGTRKQHVFKVLKRLRIETRKQRHPSHRNQFIAYITESECRRVQEEIRTRQEGRAGDSTERGLSPDLNPGEYGHFYLIQLEPEHDPGRFKVGFASSMPERVRHHRCSAPFAAVLATWPCKLLWERTAIDCVTAGCEEITKEVFRSGSLEDVKQRCERFFGLMPRLALPGACAPGVPDRLEGR